MNSRYLFALLGAAALAFACGPRGPHASGSAPAAAVTKGGRAKGAAGGVAVTPALEVTVAEGVRFALQLVNTSGKTVEVTFPSGRTHDFVVLDSAGTEVWRWSRARMFTQALQNRSIGAGDSIAFEERWEPAAAHGRFTAVAVVASDNFPIERRTDFVLP